MARRAARSAATQRCVQARGAGVAAASREGDDAAAEAAPGDLFGGAEEELVDHVDFGFGGVDAGDEIAGLIGRGGEAAEQFGAERFLQGDGEFDG
jgi:hypothetical protein